MSDVDINRLRWRCQRGMLELDHILARFLDRHYATAHASLRAGFERALAIEDADLLDMIMGRVEPPADLAEVMRLLRGEQG